MADEKLYLKPIGSRLKDLRVALNFTNRDSFAEAYGAPSKTFEKYEQGVSELPTKLLIWLERSFEVDLKWLLTGEGAMFPIASAPQRGQRSEPQNLGRSSQASNDELLSGEMAGPVVIEKLDFVIQQLAKLTAEKAEPKAAPQPAPQRPPATVTYLPFRASAGGGSVVLEDSPGFQLDIDELSQRILGMRRKNMRLIEIIGDSMLPTFMSGDVVVADVSFPRRDALPDDGEIYVLSKDGEMLVKRALWVDDGVIEWRSDNPDFSSIRVQGEEINRVKIVGKVVWLWRRPR